jgi:hypothetical protein
MIDIKYIAGFWDGEGSITIQRQKIKNSDKLQYFLYIKASNTNREVLEEIKKFFGIGVITTNGKPKEHYRQTWQYQSSCNDAYEIVKMLYPYLIIKKVQAELAMEFQERMNIYKKRCCRYSKVTVDEQEYRKNIKIMISNLNKGIGLSFHKIST